MPYTNERTAWRSARVFFRMTDLPDNLDIRFDDRLEKYESLKDARFKAERLLKACSWKSRLGNGFPVIAALMGGTGTGKSTIFNSLAGAPISSVGTRRPCTMGAIVYVHENAWDEASGGPLAHPILRAQGSGQVAEVETLSHARPESAGLILVDTPDFDSVEPANRVIADHFFIYSDVLILVTSQEKYGDLAGHEVLEEAGKWGKDTLLVMNKVVSDAAFDDFRETLNRSDRVSDTLVRIERKDSFPEMMPELKEKPQFADLFAMGGDPGRGAKTREDELTRLRTQTLSELNALEHDISSEVRRIAGVNLEIGRILQSASSSLDERLDAVVNREVQSRLRERLQDLLRKYDIFFAPRMLIRTAVTKAFRSVSGMLLRSEPETPEPGFTEKNLRWDDFNTTRASVRLEPLEKAVAELNRQVAELLASDTAQDDLCAVARKDVPRWGPQEIQAQFDKAFPGVENLLEKEFERFRNGLSRTDEIKLYGAYTFWALLLICAESVMWGGFTVLDAFLSTILVPLIPKWLLNLKVVDMLREIGLRVDREYRKTLRTILEDQAELYTREFRSLLPDDDACRRLNQLIQSLR